MKKIYQIFLVLFFIFIYLIPISQYILLSATIYIFILLTFIYIIYFKLALFSKISIYTIFIVFILLANNIIQGNKYGINFYYVSSLLWLLLVLLLIAFQNREIVFLVAKLFIISLFLELCLSFLQSIRLIRNSIELYPFSGSFGNIGSYGLFLGAVLPMTLAIALFYKKKKVYENFFYFSIFTFLWGMGMLIFSKSRTGIIGCSIGCIYVLSHFYNYKDVLKKYFFSKYIILFVVLGLSITLFYLKKDSSFGRLLVWKITIQNMNNNILTGNSIGFFDASYGKWQSNYFLLNEGTKEEKYLADYVTCTYNEFLNFFIENGVVFTILFITLMIILIFKKNSKISILYIAFKGSLLSIFFLMLFSNPFEVIPLFFYIVFCIAAIVTFFPTHKFKVKIVSLQMILSLLIMFFCFNGIKNLYGYHLMEKGIFFFVNNKKQKSLMYHTKAHKIIPNNAMCNYYLGATNYYDNNYIKAMFFLKKATEKSSNPDYMIFLGKVYFDLSLYKESEETLIKAINIQPNRLNPRYILFKNYINKKEFKKACALSKSILEIKEKRKTEIGDSIKREVFLFSKKNCF
jgi:hypothetical protein bfra3_00235